MLSVAWGTTAALVGGALGVAGGGLSLIGFAVDSAIDSAASVALVWRFGLETRDPSAAERVEHLATRAVGAVLIVAAVALTIGAGRALVIGAELHAGTAQAVMLVVSLLVLPPLAWAKGRVARRLASRALANDALLTAAAAVLALVALVVGAIATSAGFAWADPVGTIVIAAVLGREGLASLREASSG
jgi:divalent metal cation (Fe/Co/Zn/Cd) transporter